MNEKNQNQEQNFEPVVETKKTGFWGKLWKYTKCVGSVVVKVAVPIGIGAVAGYYAHDYKCKKDGTYDDAQQTRDYRERKNNRNNG